MKCIRCDRFNLCRQTTDENARRIDPTDITLPPGYQIEAFVQGLNAPSTMIFDSNGDLIIGESGYVDGRARVLRISEGHVDVISEKFEAPLIGITFYNEDLYVSHLGRVSVLKPDGSIRNIITGLPSNGDHYNSNVAINSEGKMFFGVGTATNSGVVGLDNGWIHNYPLFCDFAGSYVMLKGQNYVTNDGFSLLEQEVITGAYSPYSISNIPYEVRKGIIRASGSIMKANVDGSELEQIAWGFRYPCYLNLDQNDRLFVSNQGCAVRGSRPIANAPDEFHRVVEGNWYGWPDFVGGEPVTLPKFRPEGGVQPEFLFTSHPGVPPRPFAVFPSQSFIFGFEFNYNVGFGYYGDVFMAEFGSGGRIDSSDTAPYAGKGHRISIINMNNGVVTTFAINKSGFPSSITGEGGFGRPVLVKFGPDGAMYVLDIGINAPLNPGEYYPNTGVIWRISRI